LLPRPRPRQRRKTPTPRLRKKSDDVKNDPCFVLVSMKVCYLRKKEIAGAGSHRR
jgi:hypothetical protein